MAFVFVCVVLLSEDPVTTVWLLQVSEIPVLLSCRKV